MGTLIAEDLLLLLLDDETGRMAAASYERPLFGGALLIELALDGAVEVGEKTGLWRTAKVRVVPGTEPTDPLLAAALAAVAAKERGAQDLVTRLGKGVREELLERLVGRGMLERRDGRVLGLFPHTTWPARDAGHEREVRARLEACLLHGLTPEPRTAALIALLVAVDRAHRTITDPGTPGREVKRRAKQVAADAWAATAVRDAVLAAQAAVSAAVVASTTAATSG